MGEVSEMSQSQDNARAARIQKYKEERRKQLTARTATLFSANVTERSVEIVSFIEKAMSILRLNSN